MQRQSPGSTKHHHHHHSSTPEDVDAEKKRQRSRSRASALGFLLDRDDVDEGKLDKSVRSSMEKFIHLIPLLTFFCFLVLYLFSHDPTPQDMEAFGTFSRGMESQGEALTGMERFIGAETTMTTNRRLLKEFGGGKRKAGVGRRRQRAGDGDETRAVLDEARVRRGR